MVKVEAENRNRIPFSQRLFWSIFAMFLGFTVCFLLFQYQREREFAQDKLNNVLGNYNYQLFRRTQQTNDINKVVNQFIEDIPQKDLRVTIIDPSGITTVARYAKPDCIMKDLLSALPVPQGKDIFIRQRTSGDIFIVRLSLGTPIHNVY